MRVVAGIAGGRRLQSPATSRTRPTTDLVRGAIFNSLASLDVIEEASVVDLFAGTGACGIEALSRGARHVTFVEIDRKATAVIKSNLRELDLEPNATVINADVFTFLADKQHFDLAIADPPYNFGQWSKLLTNVDATVLVCEAEREIKVEQTWSPLRARKHGETYVTILERTTT